MSDMSLLEKVDVRALEAIPILTPEQDLQRRLARLGISAFSSESVEAYKQLKLASANRGQWWRDPVLRLNQADEGGAAVVGVLLGGFCAPPVAVIARAAGYRRLARLSLASAVVGASTLLLFSRGLQVRGRAVWVQVDPNHTRSTMPAAVAGIVDKVAAEPNMTARVDELRQESTVLDPFLVVIDPGTGARAYVAVWDEADFRI